MLLVEKVLSDAYPDGSAASDIENRKRYANVSSEQDESIYEQVVEEMLNRYGPKYGVTGRKNYCICIITKTSQTKIKRIT